MAMIDHLRSKIKGSRDESIVQAIEAKKQKKLEQKVCWPLIPPPGQRHKLSSGEWVNG